jgi:Rrf2 family protein
VITNKVEYLLRILIDLANCQPEQYVLSRDIARRRNIPPKYMPQLMAVLTGEGWVESVRGARGGVRLAADPQKLTVHDVINVAGDGLTIKKCVSETFSCPSKGDCVLLPVWQKAQTALVKSMHETTLDYLAAADRAR